MTLTLLATVTVDGFLATPAWTAIYGFFTELARRAPGMAILFNFYAVATALLLLLALMVAYTMLSLWIIAQPTVS